MIFCPKKKINTEKLVIKFGNESIDRVQSSKFLGVIIDDQLSWKQHTNHIKNKISKSIGIISKARKHLNKDALKTLYYAFVYPLILYCSIIWGNCYLLDLKPILKIQKIAVRYLAGIKRRESTSMYFEKFKILKVTDLFVYNCYIFMFKYHHKKLPNVLDSFFTKNEDVCTRETRQSKMLRVPLYKTVIGSKSIKKVGVNLWNSYIKDNDVNISLRQFKKRIIEKLVEKYLV